MKFQSICNRARYVRPNTRSSQSTEERLRRLAHHAWTRISHNQQAITANAPTYTLFRLSFRSLCHVITPAPRIPHSTHTSHLKGRGSIRDGTRPGTLTSPHTAVIKTLLEYTSRGGRLISMALRRFLAWLRLFCEGRLADNMVARIY